METFEEKGRVDLGFVFLPFRANTNGAFVFLNGSPSVVSSEQRGVEQLDISGDSNYSMLKKQYPQLQIWGNGAGFVSEHANINGGQRFILDYALVNYCHACAVGWKAQIAYDFSKDGEFKGIAFIKLIQDKNFADSGNNALLKLTGPWSQDCDGTFRAIAVHSSNPHTVYIGSSHPTKGCGIYKSINSGKTWESVNDGFPKIGLGQSIQHYPAVTKIAIAPGDPNIIYFGTFVDSGIGLVGNVYKSLDGGESWVKASGKVSLMLRQPEIKSPVLDIAIDPRNPNTAYAGLVRDGVYKTTDGGNSWDQVKKASVDISSTDIFSFVKIADSNPDVVYIGGFTGIKGYSLLSFYAAMTTRTGNV